jgi:hypothetical protein
MLMKEADSFPNILRWSSTVQWVNLCIDVTSPRYYTTLRVRFSGLLDLRGVMS